MKKLLLKIIGILLLIFILGMIVASLYATKSSQTTSIQKPLKFQNVKKDNNLGYYVQMSPVGNVYFKQVPDYVVTMDDNYNDILIALGQQHKLIATGYKNNFFWGFYKSIGITPNIDKQKIRYLGGQGQILFDRQLVYAMKKQYNAKQMVFHIDPYQLNRRKGWEPIIIQDVVKNVGPFFANRFSRQNKFRGTQPYQFYSVFELSKKVAQVYQKRQKMQQLEAFTNKMILKIQSKLPPYQKRPRVALIIYGRGRCTLFNLKSKGFGQAQYVAVGARDAFQNMQYSSYTGAQIAKRTMRNNNQRAVNLSLDLQGLLKVNPDVILVQLGIYSLENPRHHTVSSIKALYQLKNDQLGKKINAIKNGNVYPGGTPLQGPLMYLFQIQMAAKQIYPEIFGKWKPDCNYSKDEQLFDRDQLKKILGR